MKRTLTFCRSLTRFALASVSSDLPARHPVYATPDMRILPREGSPHRRAGPFFLDTNAYASSACTGTFIWPYGAHLCTLDRGVARGLSQRSNLLTRESARQFRHCNALDHQPGPHEERLSRECGKTVSVGMDNQFEAVGDLQFRKNGGQMVPHGALTNG